MPAYRLKSKNHKMNKKNVSMAQFIKFCNTCEKQSQKDLEKKIQERENYDKLLNMAREYRM